MGLQARYLAILAPMLITVSVLPDLFPGISVHQGEGGAVGELLIWLAPGVVSVALAYLLASVLVFRPLRRAATDMTRAGRQGGPVHLAQARRADELGAVARAFNHLLDTLNWTATALKAANVDLERRVAERTAELAKQHAETLVAEHKYRSIFENATEGIFQTTPQGRGIAANPAMVQMLGYDSEEQLLANATDLGHQLYADPKSREQFIAQLLGDGKVDQFEAEFVRRDKKRVLYSITAQVVRDADGNVSHLQGFIRDITQARIEQQKQRASEAEARKLALIASKTHNPIMITDPSGQLEWANNAFTELTGYSLAELIGKKPGSVLQGPDTDHATVQLMRQCIQQQQPFKVQIVNYSRAGRRYWLSIDAEPIRDETGQIKNFIAFEEDITEKKRAEWLEQDHRALLEMIARDEPLAHTLESLCRAAERQWYQVRGMVLLHEHKHWQIVAAPQLSAGFVLAMDNMLTAPNAESSCVLDQPAGFVPDLATDPAWASLTEAAQQEGVASGNVVPIVAGNGRTLGALVLFYQNSPKLDEHDQKAMQSLAGLCGMAIEHHQLIARLEYDAVHDPLTGLANRAQLDSQLPKWISVAARHDRSLAVMMVDLDGFKTVNDTLGHRCGDLLLKQVAKRLSAAIRDSDVLVRTGGDEFTLVATEVQSQADLTTVSDRLIAALIAPFQVEGRELFVTASIGMAVYPNDGMDGPGLQRCADSAMYAAKAAGRNRALRFDPKMGEAALDRLEMEGQLRRAIVQNEFLLEYQPQVNRFGDIVGVEALVRWQHPLLGRIPPNRFIPLAEQCGLVVSIGSWVLNEACRQAMAWQNSGCPPLPISVNVSALQFQQSDFIDILKAALEKSALPARYLELELTESLLLVNTTDAIGKVKAVRAMGVGVAIDDFGTGYSSLAYLQKLPIDRLKIDQSFVRELGLNPMLELDNNRAAVITAITSLASSLGMGLVAEGVETAGQRDYLVGIGCDTMQGFFFSRPVHADRIEAMLRATQTQPTPLAGAA